MISCDNKIQSPVRTIAREHKREQDQNIKRRVAIIGGGLGGVTVAYCLEGVYQVDIFEAEHKVGGHCDSQVIEYHGKTLNIDLGAQFFHPETHPLYVTLLEEVGIYDPENPEDDETLEA